MKTEKKITLRGKEYLEYLKFKEENSWFRKFNDSKKETKIAIIAGLAIFAVSLLLAMLIDALTYSPSNFKYTWDGILMFLAICAGFAWVIHGFGFILIRR